MRVIFLVIASEDPVHQHDLEIQRRTWASSVSSGSQVIWLRGFNGSIAKMDGDTLFVPCKELYGNILEKTILGIRYVLENFDFDVLVRTNVSTYFDCNRLTRELEKDIYSKPFVGGYVDKTNGKYFGNKRAFEYISGTGIFLSKSAAFTLSKLNSDDFRASPDDVAISHYLSNEEVRLIRMNRNNLASTHIFFPSFYTRAKSSADSSLAGRRMILLHEYFTSKGLLRRLRTTLKIFNLEISAFLAHPEPKIRYFQRNRVVVISYMKTKGWRLWQIISHS